MWRATAGVPWKGGCVLRPVMRALTVALVAGSVACVRADDAEQAANPRARSAHLRVAERTEAPAGPVDRNALGLPRLALEGL